MIRKDINNCLYHFKDREGKQGYDTELLSKEY